MYNCAIAQNCTLCSLCPAPLQNQIAQLRKLVARVCRSLVHAHWTICLRNCATLTKPKQRPLALTASLSRHNTAHNIAHLQQLRICAIFYHQDTDCAMHELNLSKLNLSKLNLSKSSVLLANCAIAQLAKATGEARAHEGLWGPIYFGAKGGAPFWRAS